MAASQVLALAWAHAWRWGPRLKGSSTSCGWQGGVHWHIIWWYTTPPTFRPPRQHDQSSAAQQPASSAAHLHHQRPSAAADQPLARLLPGGHRRDLCDQRLLLLVPEEGRRLLRGAPAQQPPPRAAAVYVDVVSVNIRQRAAQQGRRADSVDVRVGDWWPRQPGGMPHCLARGASAPLEPALLT